MGDPSGLERTAGAAGAGAGHLDRRARDAGGARRVWRGQAGLLTAAGQVPIITGKIKLWFQSDAHPFDL
jgi:hypothetical protein